MQASLIGSAEQRTILAALGRILTYEAALQPRLADLRKEAQRMVAVGGRGGGGAQGSRSSQSPRREAAQVADVGIAAAIVYESGLSEVDVLRWGAPDDVARVVQTSGGQGLGNGGDSGGQQAFLTASVMQRGIYGLLWDSAVQASFAARAEAELLQTVGLNLTEMIAGNSKAEAAIGGREAGIELQLDQAWLAAANMTMAYYLLKEGVNFGRLIVLHENGGSGGSLAGAPAFAAANCDGLPMASSLLVHVSAMYFVSGAGGDSGGQLRLRLPNGVDAVELEPTPGLLVLWDSRLVETQFLPTFDADQYYLQAWVGEQEEN
eukprot:g1148.t1